LKYVLPQVTGFYFDLSIKIKTRLCFVLDWVQEFNLMSDILKLLLVEDDELFRLGLITCFQQEPKIELVLEAADGEAALELAAQHKFDVAILDLKLPGLDGLETCRRLQELDPQLPIFILTSHPDKDLVLKSIEVGAKRMFEKSELVAFST
jgi:DNA-binding NarL/FixJ family response regulator